MYGLIPLTLHNHVPIIQVFIWAEKSQVLALSHNIREKNLQIWSQREHRRALYLTGFSHFNAVKATGRPNSCKPTGHLYKKALCHEICPHILCIVSLAVFFCWRQCFSPDRLWHRWCWSSAVVLVTNPDDKIQFDSSDSEQSCSV